MHGEQKKDRPIFNFFLKKNLLRTTHIEQVA